MMTQIILGSSANQYSGEPPTPLSDGETEQVTIWKDGKSLLIGCGECGSAWTEDMDSLKQLVDFWNENHD